ncbi:MAG: hypothetical protein ACRDNB_13330, partial [Gaiellaceae bacterium]
MATTRLPVATSMPQNSCPNGLGSSFSRSGGPRRNVVGAVGERDLDLDEHVAGLRLRGRDLLEPEVAGAVEAQRSHGV